MLRDESQSLLRVPKVALSGSMFSLAVGDRRSVSSPPPWRGRGGESVRHEGGTPPFYRRGVGHKWEEDREEIPMVRLSLAYVTPDM